MTATSCGSCGAQPRPMAKFCDECGAAVGAPADRAEYKQVTVLFADVVHSMDIAAALGPEPLREIMTQMFTRSAAVVERHGGTVDKFTGDGLMAVFGAPIALEDHALRACRAALDIQDDARALAAELAHDGRVQLRLRVGLNSGEVIAGGVGAGPRAYTAVGEQVGLAQRMEAAAPAGGVMIGESTAGLVHHATALGEPESVYVKGLEEPVPARRLLGMSSAHPRVRTETTFVGREWELGALRGIVNRLIAGTGSVVGVVGPPGIGKSRLVNEVAAFARDIGVEVFTTYCESHTTGLAFHAAAGLVRAAAGADGLEAQEARSAVRARFADGDAEDLALVEDLLGIGDPTVALPQIDPDARRRRLAALVSAAALARATPVVYVIEDAHWIDGVSESMLAEFLAVVPQTRSLVVITYRPEYAGPLAHSPRSQTIAVEPLDDSQMSVLSTELMGADSSVTGLVDVVASRAAGNPFFAEEIVRDLTERGVLLGERGRYSSTDPVADVSVPGTLQSAIAARIDRLPPAAKRTLNAAAVVGSRFTPKMLLALKVDAHLDDLVLAELIDQTAFGSRPEYSFRHPLIRAVAYESQLKTDRAQLHRRLAGAIDQDDQNAALIAEHLDAAGDLQAAYDWHMRAGAWATNRDIAAAHLSWERARLTADGLPADHPSRDVMRLAPRTLICGTAFRRFHPDISSRFEELRELCLHIGDKASLAVGMAGMTVELVLHGQLWEASRLGSEYMALVESIGDPELVIGLSHGAIVAKQQTFEIADGRRWIQAVIDLARGDPNRGAFILGSPLAAAVVWRAAVRWMIGEPGWQEDHALAEELVRGADPLSRATVIAYKYLAISRGVLIADDGALRDIEDALRSAERSGDDIALTLLRMTFATALIHHGADRMAGFELARLLRDTCMEQRFALNIVPFLDTYLALGVAERGDAALAVEQLDRLVDEMLRDGHLVNVEVTLAFLVTILSSQGRIDEAASAIDRLSALDRAIGGASRDVIVLGLRTWLALASGDESAYREFRDRYRAMANDLRFEGHMAWAAALP